MNPKYCLDGWMYQTFEIKCGVRSRDGQIVDDPDASPQYFTWSYRKAWTNGRMELMDGDLEPKIKAIFKGRVVREFKRIAYCGTVFFSFFQVFFQIIIASSVIELFLSIYYWYYNSRVEYYSGIFQELIHFQKFSLKIKIKIKRVSYILLCYD